MTWFRTATTFSLALAAAPLPAQIARNVPSGNPLGSVPIVMPRGDEPGAAAAPDGAAELLRQQQDAALQAQQRAAYRARQAALAESARPLAANNGYVDLGRLGDEQRAAQTGPQDAGRTLTGTVPSPFGRMPNIFAGGIRTPWSR